MIFNQVQKVGSLINENTLAFMSLDGSRINQASAYKYLGIWLDRKLSFKIHID
jgi:hypothetical protein